MAELKEMPEAELLELAGIYEEKGLNKDLSIKVATQLTIRNALAAQAHDELGISDITKARPFQAALASEGSFVSVQLFAKVEPNQKERIILSLKKGGHVVGFMGVE